jgi:hypothetical protein
MRNNRGVVPIPHGSLSYLLLFDDYPLSLMIIPPYKDNHRAIEKENRALEKTKLSNFRSKAQSAFDEFDPSRTGYVERENLGPLLRKLGMPAGKLEVFRWYWSKVFENLDGNCAFCLRLWQLCVLWTKI